MMNVPAPQYGANDKETLQNLMDTVTKLRKELVHLTAHLDEDNIPSLAGMKGDIERAHTAILQTETEINLVAQGLANAQSSISVMSGQIALKVSESDYTASVIVSKINDGTVTISASKINLDGVTTMSGLARVHSTLEIGSPTVDGIIRLRDGIELWSMSGDELWIQAPTLPVANGAVHVVSQRFTHNFKKVLTDDDRLSIENWVSSQGYASGNFAVSNQGLRIQDYAGHLEIYQGSTFIGKLKYV